MSGVPNLRRSPFDEVAPTPKSPYTLVSLMIAGRISGRRHRTMQVFDLNRAPLTDPLTIYRYRDGMYAADLLTGAIARLDFFSWLAEHPSDKGAICAR